MIDTIASEYGWNIEYIINLPVDVCGELCHALLRRRGARVWRRRLEAEIPQDQGLAKRLDAIFNKLDKD